MSSEAERQFPAVVPPEQSNTAGIGVTILQVTTAAANAVVPAALFHRYVDVVVRGDTVWLAFGPNGSPNVDKTRTGGTTFATGTNSQNAVPVADGGGISVRLDPTAHAQLSFQSNSANAKLYIYPSSQASRL